MTFKVRVRCDGRTYLFNSSIHDIALKMSAEAQQAITTVKPGEVCLLAPLKKMKGTERPELFQWAALGWDAAPGKISKGGIILPGSG